MKEHETCGICHEPYPQDQLIEFDGELYCSNCLGIETVFCSHCGERIWNDENAGSCNTPLCRSCYDDYYVTCTTCGRILSRDNAYYENDEDDPYCYNCHAQYHDDRIIHDYYYKPDPIFFGNGKRYFGVELEIDEAGECDNNADSIMFIANCNGLDHAYCKHDGSLDDGFEIVTHPMTLEYHEKEMPWEKVLNKVRAMGYTSHKAGTCGLHVHVSRDSLGETYDEQDSIIARILYFIEKHWDELIKFSRRTPRQLERWASRYGYKDQPKEILDHAKKGVHRGRYTCINLENDATIEFRMFRGTLKLNTLIATLQLVDRICDVAISLSDEQIKAMSWTTFVSGCTEPELVQYLKERQLYINDPVESEVEI